MGSVSAWREAAGPGYEEQDDDGYARGPAHCLACGGFLKARDDGEADDAVWGHGFRFTCGRCGRYNWLVDTGWML